jgi:phage tail-like protein
MAVDTTRTDPYRSFRYRVEIEGIQHAGFTEVAIADSAQDPIEYREGTHPPTMRKIPGLVKYGNVTLKWGITDSMDLYKWRKAIEDGKTAGNRKNMAIVLMDEEGKEKSRWNFSNAWPTKYDPADLKATANEIAIETLEIAHEKMERVS